MEDDRQDHVQQRFSANLRLARERTGLSQEALAEQMRNFGFPSFRQNTIYRIETGSRSVKLEEALALSRATNTSIDSLARPRGLSRQAWRVLDTARVVRQLAKSLAENARQLSAARKHLQVAMDKVREEDLETELADEMSIGRYAIAEDVFATLQAMAEELVTPARWGSGRRLTASEREFARRMADTLTALAADGAGAVPSFLQEPLSFPDAAVQRMTQQLLLERQAFSGKADEE